MEIVANGGRSFMDMKLSNEEKDILLKIARTAIQNALEGYPNKPIQVGELTEHLKEPGATFVTLTKNGELRGCIGTLEPYLPLYEDVREHAIAAALNDYRFPPVQPSELPLINIEISRLTPPQPLSYENPDELVHKLRPNIDGVVLQDGMQKATFLPQVWEKLPFPEEFLNHLCIKMGSPMDLWRRKKLQVFTYQVEEFHE